MIPLKDNIPTERVPWVTIALIVANVVVFLLEIRHGGSFWSGPSPKTTVDYGAIPYEITHPGKHCELVNAMTQQIACEGQRGVTGHAASQPRTIETLFTSMFMHAGILHLAGNMIFLWIFGNNVEDAMGRVRYLIFYLLGGLAATALQVAVHPDAAVPSVGASGAIAAVLGGYLVMYPRAQVLTLLFLFIFFTFIQLPALLFLVIWFAEQIVFGLTDLTNPTGGGGGVAYFAHVGGFVFGALAIKLFATRVKRDYLQPKYPLY
jgi:membrane associated rhomboid family serine protease